MRSEKNIQEAFVWVIKTMKSVDVLINNADVFKKSDLLGTYVKCSMQFIYF